MKARHGDQDCNTSLRLQKQERIMVLRPAKEPDTLSKNTNKNKFFK
jgi:hypothetical protein